jgi:hypothetical protein
MNCKTYQRELMQVEDPVRPPAALQGHLDRCPACRDWLDRLVRIEQHVRWLPVPESDRLAAVRQQVLFPPPAPVLPLPPPLRSARLVWGAAGAAAALLLAALLWWSRGRDQGPDALVERPTPDPFLASLMERNLTLARAESPRDRVEALAGLADDLHGETRLLATTAEARDLDDLASLYDQVVRQGVAARARDLPPEQARQVLSAIAARLGQTGAACDELARQLSDDSARPLRTMAATARDVQQELVRLLEEMP